MTTQHDNQKFLKGELQNAKAADLEKLAAALIGQLLELPIAVASSGFQHGGDAGPAGRHGRRFRIECKRYGDDSQLDRRSLQGEIDQALEVDEALEAWILVATCPVSEQKARAVIQHGEKLGVPVLILDWPEYQIAMLAALCAYEPTLVGEFISEEAEAYATALRPICDKAIASLHRELQVWCLGFEALRERSHEKLRQIWTSPRASNAALLQDAAGGARPNLLKRLQVHDALSVWWRKQGDSCGPAAVFGWDGVGKTWAAIHWLVEQCSDQPIILAVPSGAAAGLRGVSEVAVKEFLADRLYEVAGVRDRGHWVRRLDRLLNRPAVEGPVLTVFLDGLNQEPTVPWLDLLKVLQGDAFASHTRVIISTRTHYLERKLQQLRGLIDSAVRVPVDFYSVEPGGELDQMLALKGVRRDELPSELIEYARRPRLFELILRLRDRPAESGPITVHRLLWEYGQGTLGVGVASFSESEWRAWLKQIAEKYRDGIRAFTLASLGETTARRDLTEREVEARLSDIIDGRFAIRTATSDLQLSPAVVAHALGAGLVARLSAIEPATFGQLESELNQWLDPIAGFDQRAEILRAAVSIVVELGRGQADIASALVTAWLQTQNIDESHRSEVAALAPSLVTALLDAVEHSGGTARSSARYWAIRSLKSIPRGNIEARGRIVSRVKRWLSSVSRDVDPRPEAAEGEKRRAEMFKLRIGVDESGPRTVAGIRVELVDQGDGALLGTIAPLLDGYPLAPVLSVFELAAVGLAIRNRSECWEELKWLCYLNEIDPDETAVGLRERSRDILRRPLDSGVHAELPRRIAGFLLRLSGRPADEDDAVPFETSFDRSWTYENDYLASPARSFFSLERRHALDVLLDSRLPMRTRIQRTAQLWLDPTFQPPAAFIEEVERAIPSIDVAALDRTRGRTIEDISFEEIEPVLARCVPELLADLIRRKLQGIVTCSGEARLSCSYVCTDHLVLAGDAEVHAAKMLRIKERHQNEKEESYAASRLLMIEIKELDAESQFAALIDADLGFILRDFRYLLRRPTAREVDVIIDRYSSSCARKQESLLALLSVHAPQLSDRAWEWADGFVRDLQHELRPLAFRTLGRSDPMRLGKELAAQDWSWSPDEELWVNHYGSRALVEATRHQSFEEIASRLAPWRLLEATRLRGGDPQEVRLAARILSHVLEARNLQEPDLGSNVSIELSDSKEQPFLYSVELRKHANPVDSAQAFKAAFDLDAQQRNYDRAAEAARNRLEEARKSGASLFLVSLETEDLALALTYAPEIVERWIEGHGEPTADFRRRVRLAEAAYLALCEALLVHDPARGVQLWRGLRKTVATRYIGAIQVDDLTHMAFRAPWSEPVEALRRELLALTNANTDQALFDYALAAIYNGHSKWLAAIINEDLDSTLVWRQRRGMVLASFTINNTLPVHEAWPEGPIRTSHAELRFQCARRRLSQASAYHWWREYIEADSMSQAYAAWVLFVRSADQRAYLWMHEDFASADTDRALARKLAHAELNRALPRFAKKRIDKADQRFLGRDIGEGLGPWP